MSKSSEWAANAESGSADVDESTLDPSRNEPPTDEEMEEIREGLAELVEG